MRLTITQKIHLPVILSIMAGFGIVWINYIYSIDDMKIETYSAKEKMMRSAFKESMDTKKSVGLTNALNISKNYSVISALEKNEQSIALDGLREISQAYKLHTSFKNVKLHIHDANMHSFLREWKPEKFGDDLSSFRTSIVDVKQMKKPVIAIELGRAGMLLRGVSPIVKDNKYLGSVEFIQGLNSLSKTSIEHYDFYTIVVMKNKYLDIATFLKNAPQVEDYCLAVKQENVNLKLLNDLENIDINKTSGYSITDEFIIASEPIIDYSNNVVGYALLASNLLEVNSIISKSKESLVRQVYIMALLDIFILIIIGYFINPYMKLFITLQEGIKKAYTGDFTYNFTTNVSGEGQDIVNQINTLFGKLQSTFGDIKADLGTFIANNQVSNQDPLLDAKTIIKELSDIYRFKKTIELDPSKEIVYLRIIDVFHNKFNIADFALYEVDNVTKQRAAIYERENGNICKKHINLEVNDCRAFRTKTNVISTEFTNLCQGCKSNDLHYICIPFTITTDYSLILTFVHTSLEEIQRISGLEVSIQHYLQSAKPIIESNLLMDKLRDSSLRDGMTNLYNRRFLEEFVNKFINQVKREKESYSVLMLDVDFFKLVNDNYGHDIGDNVIVEIGKILKESIRESDLAIRYGGEEFVILLHNATDEGTLEIAKKIHKKFGAQIFNVGNGEKIQKTLSIGISKFPSDADSIWKCIKHADTALYVAKTTGRNKIVSYTHEMENEDVSDTQEG